MAKLPPPKKDYFPEERKKLDMDFHYNLNNSLFYGILMKEHAKNAIANATELDLFNKNKIHSVFVKTINNHDETFKVAESHFLKKGINLDKNSDKLCAIAEVVELLMIMDADEIHEIGTSAAAKVMKFLKYKIKMESNSIYHNLEDMKMVAVQSAKDHGCNYNVILMCPDSEGKFNRFKGSTYEMVANSFFNKPRPNAVLLHKTDDLIKAEENEKPVEVEHKSSLPYNFLIPNIDTLTLDSLMPNEYVQLQNKRASKTYPDDLNKINRKVVAVPINKFYNKR